MLDKIGGYISTATETAQEHLGKGSYFRTKFVKSLSEFNLPLEIIKGLNKLVSGVIDSKKIDEFIGIVDNKIQSGIKENIKQGLISFKEKLIELKSKLEEVESQTDNYSLGEIYEYILQEINRLRKDNSIFSTLIINFWEIKKEEMKKKAKEEMKKKAKEELNQLKEDYEPILDSIKNSRFDLFKGLVDKNIQGLNTEEGIQFVDNLILQLKKTGNEEFKIYLKDLKHQLCVKKFDDLISARKIDEAVKFAYRRKNSAGFSGNKELIIFWEGKIKFFKTQTKTKGKITDIVLKPILNIEKKIGLKNKY